jgi:antibiotic biosynthesis monooxygenase (ABM) superfamily enzyme
MSNLPRWKRELLFWGLMLVVVMLEIALLRPLIDYKP